ncbi:SIR2 family protein [Sphingobium chungbukense]|uniref:SIR2-like domain-containing protein n=1 Tax=Sphingobium chungbukense TaxID=56193 RepID=A0A0M3AVB8_9SPHN|nr:SIR2 family protein [Sphingobium chungbukense]KKW92519.1 hypothetical protein YP76_06090 [Sphingobium chungbukense]
MALVPTASQITVPEVLTKFGAEFEAVANAVENGEFALWVGSGISRRAPNLGNLIESAFDYLREGAIDPARAAAFMPAFEEALGLAEVPAVSVKAQYSKPLATWPEHDAIIDRLWNKYSRVLEIPIAGHPADFILWDAIDIRAAFDNPEPPAAEHLCMAILIMEGAVQAIASANWDGFIEAAVDRLSGGVPGYLQVVVDPGQLRGPVGRARLLKFHGCIVHATREPLVFRRFLTGSHTQIQGWPEEPEFAAMCQAVVTLATSHKTMVMGLSIQDNNLQTLFTRARVTHAWPWPSAPDAPAHIFCEDRIQQGQRDVLRLSYGQAYNDNPAAAQDATLLRAWGETVLIALVLKLLTDKLGRLMDLSLAQYGKGAIATALTPALTALEHDIAALAVPAAGEKCRTSFVNRGISLWSRALALFRNGALPSNPECYEALCSSTPNLIAADPNALGMGLGKFGIALALLQNGSMDGLWELKAPTVASLEGGALAARALHAGGIDRPVFVVKSATEAITLQSQGAFANDNAVVIHGDDAWRQMGGLSGPTVSPRRVSTAPGRTGSLSNTHVSLGALLMRCTDAAELQREFVAEMML